MPGQERLHTAGKAARLFFSRAFKTSTSHLNRSPFCNHLKHVAFSAKIKGNLHLQGNVQVNNVKIPVTLSERTGQWTMRIPESYSLSLFPNGSSFCFPPNGTGPPSGSLEHLLCQRLRAGSNTRMQGKSAEAAPNIKQHKGFTSLLVNFSMSMAGLKQ